MRNDPLPQTQRRSGGLCLRFAPGERPGPDAIAACAATAVQTAGFTISHRPSDQPRWLELLVLGLPFDLEGLAPGMASATPMPAHGIAFCLEDSRKLEVLTVRPASHWMAGTRLMPVVRALVALGCTLVDLPGLRAIGWEPARTVMTPDYWRRVMTAWLQGGAFPSLGLAAMSRTDGGTVESEELRLFLGREVRIAPAAGEAWVDTARFAVRVFHDLVERGLYPPDSVTGPSGLALQCDYLPNSGPLWIRRSDGGTAASADLT